MAILTTVPVQVYLRSTFEPDAEYVDGEIQERPVGEYDHAAWQAAIVNFLWQHGAEWKIRVLPELRVQVSPNRFRVPDVTVLDRHRPIEQVVTQPPLAVFEILSPEDTMARMLVKLSDYERMGIPGIFVVDPNGKRYRFQAGMLAPVEDRPISLGPVQIDFAQIERLLD